VVQASRVPRQPGRPHHKNAWPLFLAALGLTVILAVGSAAARAQVPVPAGLEAGDTYQLVFVTSCLVGITSAAGFPPSDTGSFCGIPDADWLVTYFAYNAGLVSQDWNWQDTVYHAILSDYASDAIDGIPIVAPVYNMHGDLVAATRGQFWSGNHQAAINYDENGQPISGSQAVWTGSYWDGTRAEDSCKNWNMPFWEGTVGNANSAGMAWARNGMLQGDYPARLYAVSPPVIVGPYIAWNTPGGGAWNTGPGNRPWVNNAGSPAAFTTGTPVAFSLGGTLAVTVDAGGVQPGPMTVGIAGTAGSYSLCGGPIAGSAGLAIFGGTVTLNNANTYSGGTTLNGGQLDINNGGSGGTSSAIGTGTLTISGGSIDNTSSGDVTLSTNNAQVWNTNFTYLGSAHNLNLGTGAVTLWPPANGGVPEPGNWYGAVQITVAANTLAVGGPISGGNWRPVGYSLIKAGGGTLVLAGSNTYYNLPDGEGSTAVVGGTLSLSGGGAIAGTGDIAVYQGSTLLLDNSTTNLAGRLAGAARVDLIGGTLSFLGNNTAQSTEGIGQLNLWHGQSTVTISGGTGAGSNGVLTIGPSGDSNWADLFSRGWGAMVNFTATIPGQGGPGGTFTGNDVHGGGDRIFFGGPGPGGGGTGPGSINMPAAWMVVNGSDFASYSDSQGIHQAGSQNIPRAPTLSGAASGDTEVLITAQDPGACGSKTVACLVVQSATALSNTLTGTLNIANSGGGQASLDHNGGICIAGSAPFTPSGGYTLNGGTITSGVAGGYSELLVWIDSGTTTINSAIQDIGGGTTLLSKNGSGTLVLGGANTYSYGTTLNAGVLTFSNGALPFSTSSPNIWFYGGTLQWAPGNTQDVSAGIAPLQSTSTVLWVPSYREAIIDTNGNDVTFGSPLSGYGGLTKLGAGTLTLSASNSYTGVTTVSGGTLQLGNGSTANGAVQGDILNQSAVVFANPLPQTYSGVISGSGGLTMAGPGTFTLTGSNTYSGSTTVNGGTLQLGDGAAANGSVQGNILNESAVVFATPLAQTYSGVISGNGSLTMAGSGTLTLTGSNTYTGGTTIANCGTLQLGDGAAANGYVQGNIVLNWGNLAFANPLPQTYAGVVSGNGNLIMAGPGTLTLTGSNTYSGFTTVSGGTLQVGSGGGTGSVGSGSLWVDSGATLAFNRGDAYTVPNAIIGYGGLIQAGSGALTLTASNSYSGGTTVAGGTLVAENAAAIPSGSLLEVGPGGSVVLGNPACPEPLGLPGGSVGPLDSQASGDPQAGATIHAVPEPGTVALLAAGLACGAAIGMRRRTPNPKTQNTKPKQVPRTKARMTKR
jgi:autotransporter-associated beta strand protein